MSAEREPDQLSDLLHRYEAVVAHLSTQPRDTADYWAFLRLEDELSRRILEWEECEVPALPLDLLAPTSAAAGPKVDDRIWAATLELLKAYLSAHPELALQDAVRQATLVGEGICLLATDDDRGRVKLIDGSGRGILTLDLSGWLPPRES